KVLLIAEVVRIHSSPTYLLSFESASHRVRTLRMLGEKFVEHNAVALCERFDTLSLTAGREAVECRGGCRESYLADFEGDTTKHDGAERSREHCRVAMRAFCACIGECVCWSGLALSVMQLFYVARLFARCPDVLLLLTGI
ncbi:hypothetical protein Tcan_00576, partial [Toxocara canis]